MQGECEPASLARHNISTVPSERDLHCFRVPGSQARTPPSILANARLVSPLKGGWLLTISGRAKPRGSSTEVSPSRGLLRSDNVTPVRASAVSHLAPVVPSRREPKLAEAPFDPKRISGFPEAEASVGPRPHHGAEAPRCVPVRNRDSVQVRNSTRRLPSSDLVKAGLPREVVPPAEAVGRAIRVSPSRWRPSVSRSDHREVSQPPCLPDFHPSSKTETTGTRNLSQARTLVAFRDVGIVFARKGHQLTTDIQFPVVHGGYSPHHGNKLRRCHS